MKANVQYQNKNYIVDFDKPIDISLRLTSNQSQVNCFNAPLVQIEPLVAGEFVGSLSAGSPVNFMNIKINPHGNGTHTECLAHISESNLTINKVLTKFHFFANLITIDLNDEKAIKLDHLKSFNLSHEALIIRTLPNEISKKTKNYSGTNPAHIEEEAMKYIVDQGVRHLLIDLPSVDPEVDGGKLVAHRAFWQVPENPRNAATITELIYVPNEIQDGIYLLNIQIISLEMDASPSKVVLYNLEA